MPELGVGGAGIGIIGTRTRGARTPIKDGGVRGRTRTFLGVGEPVLQLGKERLVLLVEELRLLPQPLVLLHYAAVLQIQLRVQLLHLRDFRSGDRTALLRQPPVSLLQIALLLFQEAESNGSLSISPRSKKNIAGVLFIARGCARLIGQCQTYKECTISV